MVFIDRPIIEVIRPRNMARERNGGICPHNG
jgi:hypothetical protein